MYHRSIKQHEVVLLENHKNDNHSQIRSGEEQWCDDICQIDDSKPSWMDVHYNKEEIFQLMPLNLCTNNE